MKKILIFTLVFVLLLSGCSYEPERAASEISGIELHKEGEPVEENPEKESSENHKFEVPENDPAWENFVDQMIKLGYDREEIEALEAYGFKRDEIKSMTWVDVVRGLGMIHHGFNREEVDFALEILRNGTAIEDETFVLVGDSTKRYELIEEFISSVEKNEEAFVHGVAIGNTMPCYFELSYKPGEKIKYSMISEHSVLKDEFSEIYDTEAFCRFSGEMESLTLPKIELWPGEQLKFSSEQDVPGKAVTLEKAKEKATEIMVLTRLENDEYEYTEEYLDSFEPRCDGIFDIAGKPYYRIGFYIGENADGGTFYICAEESEVVFAGSEIDGRLIPIATGLKPRIVLG